MRLFKADQNQLIQVDRDPFKLEKHIQQLVEENLSILFELQFVVSEFKVGEFRIDTLAFDESSNSFVIIEYKNKKDRPNIARFIFIFLTINLDKVIQVLGCGSTEHSVSARCHPASELCSKLYFVHQEKKPGECQYLRC